MAWISDLFSVESDTDGNEEINAPLGVHVCAVVVRCSGPFRQRVLRGLDSLSSEFLFLLI